MTLDCSDEAAVVANEAAQFAADVCLETVVIPNTGQVLNFHPSCSQSYRTMLDWLDLRVGTGATAASDPCGSP